jgi:putative membrane protein
MNKNTKIALIIGGIALFIVLVLPPILGALGVWGSRGWDGRNWGTMGPGMMGGFGFWWLMPIFMIIFWGLIIWGIVALIRGPTSAGSPGSAKQADSALEILKRRYARGEINKQEYDEKKKDLTE